MRDRIMRGIGTDEPWIMEEHSEQWGERAVAVHYRRPLSIIEVGQMERTAEVLARPGRA